MNFLTATVCPRMVTQASRQVSIDIGYRGIEIIDLIYPMIQSRCNPWPISQWPVEKK